MMNVDEMIGRAFVRALRAHAGQVDKSGAPYIGHVARVAASVEGRDEIVVALLHDVVEDTGVSLSDLADDFPDDIIEAVDAITHRPGEPREDYYRRVAKNALARCVKLADIADNASPQRMSLLDEATRMRLEKKYAKALEHLEAD